MDGRRVIPKLGTKLQQIRKLFSFIDKRRVNRTLFVPVPTKLETLVFVEQLISQVFASQSKASSFLLFHHCQGKSGELNAWFPTNTKTALTKTSCSVTCSYEKHFYCQDKEQSLGLSFQCRSHNVLLFSSRQLNQYCRKDLSTVS